MTSSRKKIIRNLPVEGILFCTPSGVNVEDPQVRQEKEHLKALEKFWHKKGVADGQQKGLEEGMRTGQEKGRRKGYQKGEQQGHKKGHAEGYELGLKEGEEKARAQLSETLELVGMISCNIKETQESLYEDAKAELISFSIAVCEQVMCQQLACADVLHPLIGNLIHQAQPIIKQCPVEIYLPPGKLEQLKELKLLEKLSNSFPDGEATAVRFLADKTMSAEDCRLETPLGLINFDIRRALASIEKKTLEVRTDEQIPRERPSPTEQFQDTMKQNCLSKPTI